VNSERDHKCRVIGVEELSEFVECELDIARRQFVEAHLLKCVFCQQEVNFQKRLQNTLGGALRFSADRELPVNFSQVLMARAECNVDRIRSGNELRRALSIFLVIAFMVSVGAAFSSSNVVSYLPSVFNQTVTIGSFVVHFFADILTGVFFALRVIVSQFSFSVLSTVLVALAMLSVIGILASRQRIQPQQNPNGETQD